MRNYRLLIFSFIVYSGCAAAASQEVEMLSPEVQASLHGSVINPLRPHLVFDNNEQAQAWLKDMSNRLKPWVQDPVLRKRYLTIIQYEASRSGLDPQLILAVITIESKFSKYAISSVGARGLMQVMPFWQKAIGTPSQNLFDIETNLRYGCTILRYYLWREHGNINRALARYNGSLGELHYPQLVINAYNTYWAPYPMVTLKNGKLTYIDYTGR